MPETLLSIRNLTVQYGRFLAVDALSFDLAAGSLLGMIGPNGAGKTTTLRAAAGLLAPSGGTVHVMGYDVGRHATAVGNHLGFAPDSPAVYESLTVQEFLRFIGDAYGMPRRLVAERIDMWLEQLWLTDKRGARVSSLSRGMRQRLTVARTLIPDPHVILLDEPAAGLDPAGRMYFRKLLAGLRDQGKAIIVSSHILADLAEYCTHILIMERGRVRRFGTVAQVTDDAGHERCLYRVQLAEPIGDAAARIAHLSGLTRLALSGDRLDFEYLSDRRAAAQLLRGMLDAGLPVAAFHALAPNLEEAYLRTGIGQVD
ncbi:MAG: putative ABC transporter ATP-binding protein YxlF [Phycisphaerae bacterium]|nr:putative ABC transporter ATP-binding protein YxlF [Phycisphaerae bacterium]